MKNKRHKKDVFLEKYKNVITKHQNSIPTFCDLETLNKQVINTQSWFSMHRCCTDKHNIKILFESDYTPLELARFIGRLDPFLFGINLKYFYYGKLHPHLPTIPI